MIDYYYWSKLHSETAYMGSDLLWLMVWVHSQLARSFEASSKAEALQWKGMVEKTFSHHGGQEAEWEIKEAQTRWSFQNIPQKPTS